MGVPRDTMLQAPRGSMLHTIFSRNENSPEVPRDGQGRMFLNFPPQSFERIVDHFRLLELARQGEFPMLIASPPQDREQEFRTLAQILGIEEFLMGGRLLTRTPDR